MEAQTTKSECWIWTGLCDAEGYGIIRFAGKQWSIHQLAYSLYVGPIWGKTCVLHHCDTPACWNPEHLFRGAQADNVRDMDNKRRRAATSGAANVRAKLTEADVVTIRAEYPQVKSYAELARRFGVNKTQIMRIVRQQSWRA